MRIHKLVHTPQEKTVALSVRHDQKPQNHNIWHYHDELEFIHINRGSGSCFVGDSIQHFTSGDIFLIGSNTPHYWLFDDEYLQENSYVIADIRVVHFLPDFCSNDLLQLDETKHIRKVYETARRGMLFHAPSPYLLQFFDNIGSQKPLNRFVSLLTVLDTIYTTQQYRLLASSNYANLQHTEDYQRMNKVLEYIRLHYRATIKLQYVAHQAGMTTNSFCRYFKQKMGKTLIQLVHELRIAHACKLLENNHLSIKEICFECGFQNFVSFHKSFKQIVGIPPNSYRLSKK